MRRPCSSKKRAKRLRTFRQHCLFYRNLRRLAHKLSEDRDREGTRYTRARTLTTLKGLDDLYVRVKLLP